VDADLREPKRKWQPYIAQSDNSNGVHQEIRVGFVTGITGLNALARDSSPVLNRQSGRRLC
jgi:hypothetical protein